MTCTETRAYFESSALENDSSRDHSAEVAEHARNCAACSRFLGEQTELNRRLILVRAAAPQISPMLDSAVLANFRKRTECLTVPGPVRLSKAMSPAAWLWRGAFAAVILGAVVLTVAYRKTTPQGRTVRATRPAAVSQTMQPASAPAPVRRSSSPRRARHAASAPVAASPAAQRGSSPAEFASLMYCDQLSCGGPMEVIRMQLPTAMAGRPSAWQRTGAVVYADVLIGSDGVARGIRTVE